MTDLLRDQLQATLAPSYTIERELGGGGMSRVFVAEETRFRRRVVVKVLAPALAAGLSAERFEREIGLAAQLQQANVVPVLTAGEVDGLPWYTMPFVEGESLRARLAEGPLPLSEAVSVLRDVARALGYAHGRGIVHRDIKPDNVLLSGGAAVVTDFGIAKAVSASRTQAPGGTLTQVGTSLGTPAYMAPEQAAGDDLDHRADLYAWGVMAYELLTGRHPFAGRTTAQQLVAAHIAEAPRPLGDVAPDVPAALAAVVMRCLAKDPSSRPASAPEVLRALDDVGGAAAASAAAPALTPARVLALWALATAAVALLARAATLVLGLPDWVLPGALGIMGLALLALGVASRRRQPARALRWSAAALGAYAVAVAAFMALRALGIGPAGSLLAAGKLGERPRLLVADFNAPAADSTLGHVVAEAVKTSLGQSRVVGVVPASEVAAALARMRRPADARLDVATAREVAERAGVGVVVAGDVAPLGGGAFLLTARLLDAATGDALASAQEAARAPDDLIPAIDRAARALRGRLGESFKAVRAAPPLSRVTTASLAALRAYDAGLLANRRSDFLGAVSHLERAIGLDSTFASAYSLLSVVLTNARTQPARADSLRARAYALRDRLPDTERLRATFRYFSQGRHRDPGRALATAESLVVLDPTFLNSLGVVLSSRGEFDGADSTYRRALAQRPLVIVWENLIGIRLAQRKLAAAESAVAGLLASGLPPSSLPIARATAAYLRGRPDSAAVLARQIAASPATSEHIRLYALELAAQLEEVRGRLGAARELRAELTRLLGRLGNDTLALRDSIALGLEDVWLRGEPARARQRVAEALRAAPLERIAPEHRPYLELASLTALAGDPKAARAWIARFDADVRDTATVRLAGPLRHDALAQIALAERRWDDALRERDLASLDVGGAPSRMGNSTRDFGRGVTHALAGRTDDAIASLERALVANFSDDGVAPDNLYRATTYERLGELYEAKGDGAKALDYYGRLVELWKDADADLQPRVAEVRRRMARLRARTG